MPRPLKTLYERLDAAGAVRAIYAREFLSHARRSGSHKPQSPCVQVLHVTRGGHFVEKSLGSRFVWTDPPTETDLANANIAYFQR